MVKYNALAAEAKKVADIERSKTEEFEAMREKLRQEQEENGPRHCSTLTRAALFEGEKGE